MAEETIDALSIEISGSTDSVSKGIDKLIQKLDKLEIACASITSLQGVESKLARLDNTVKKMNFANLDALKNIKVSTSAANGLDKLAASINALPTNAEAKLTSIAKALSPLAALNGVKLSATIISRIKELPQALKEYERLDMSRLVRQIEQLNSALAGIIPNLSAYASIINSLPKSYRTAASATRTVISTNKQLGSSADTASTKLNVEAAALTRLYSKGLLVWAGLRRVVTALGGFIDESNSYIENMNLFAASMGAAAESATDFGMRAQNLLGIDFGEWARNQGVFQTLITGMGVVTQRADVMSQQLTQLGYDIASFYNISVEEAMTKIQSGVAGELEPLRRLGWDLSNARMNLELTKMGIDATAQQMTQAEKVALRYYLIMNQVTITHGDMARTIASPANQLRVLKAQTTLAARAIGNLLIPALNMILPVVIAVVKAIRILAEELAAVFGIDATFEVDYSSLDTSGLASAGEDAADSLEDANDKAKELKNTVMGFDELNKMSDVSDANSKKNDGLGGIGLDLPLDTYDFFEGLTDAISEKTDAMARKIADALKMILPIAAAIGAAFALWKLGTFLSGLSEGTGLLSAFGKNVTGVGTGVKTVGGLLKTFAGLALAAAGALMVVHGAGDALINGLSWTDFFEMFGGAALMIGGLALSFGPVGAAVGAVIGGIALLVTGLKDLIEAGEVTVLNCTSICVGFGLVGAAIGLLVGGPIGALVGALIGVGVGLVAAFCATNPEIMDSLNELGDAIDQFCTDVVDWFTPLTEPVDALADVSEETAERFGTSLDSMREAQLQLKLNDFSNDVVSQEDVDNITGRVEDIKNTILANLDSERNAELAALDTLGGGLSEERKQQIIDGINAHYENVKTATEEGQARIYEIYTQAASEHRDLTNEEAAEIQNILDTLNRHNIEEAGATEEEMTKINNAMSKNERQAALEAANEVLAKAAEKRDKTVEAAWEEYREQEQKARKMRDIGAITEEEYQGMVKSAETMRDNTINAANETYYGDNGVLKNVKNGLGEASKYIDDETGDIKSDWDLFCNDLGTQWEGFCRDFNNVVNDVGNGFNSFINSCGQAWNNFTVFCDQIGQSMKNAANVIVGALNTVIGGLEWMVNSAASALNAFRLDIPDWIPFVGGTSISFNLPRVQLPRIPYFAEGGFPEQGQLFFARENGAEMVGQMGNRTAVANNQQIVAGIEEGVVRAMLQVMASTESTDDDSDGRPVELVLRVGNEDLARATHKGYESLVRRGELKLAFT